MLFCVAGENQSKSVLFYDGSHVLCYHYAQTLELSDVYRHSRVESGQGRKQP